MSGFFEDLVARSFAPAVALRPRLQSLYEPPTRDDGARIDSPATLFAHTRREQVLEETADEPQPRKARHTMREAERGERAQRVRALPTEEEETRHPLPAAEPATLRVTRTEKIAAPLLSLASREIQPPAPRPALQPRPVHADRPIASPAAGDAVHGAESRGQSSTYQRKLPDTAAPLKPVPFLQPAPPQVVQAIAPRREPRESPELRPRTLQPALSMPTVNYPRPLAVERSLRHSEAPRPAMRASSEPTVHVTIGRIEIRAEVQEPPARPAARPRPPAGPNLDDYLRQHAQKGRS